MTTFNVMSVSDDHLYWGAMLFIGYASSIISVIVCISISCNLIYVHFQTYHNDTNQDQPHNGGGRHSHLLKIAYCIASVITCSTHIFFRTNLITQLSIPTYRDAHQCSIGWALFNIFYFAMGYLLSLIFLYRVKVIFEGSTFQYSSWVFKAFHGIFIFLIIVYIMCLSLFSYRGHWVLYKDAETNIFYCDFDIANRPKYAYFRVFFLVSQIVINGILLYMFIRGLWVLNKQMIKQFAKDHVMEKSITISQVSLDVDMVLDKYSEQNCTSPKKESTTICTSAEQIVQLHILIKKTTILVCVAMISAIVYHVCVVVDTFAIQLFGIDVVINVLCVWLMCNSSLRYWKCCKKYGLYQICYRKENRNGL